LHQRQREWIGVLTLTAPRIKIEASVGGLDRCICGSSVV
jgi:hypothetical protein